MSKYQPCAMCEGKGGFRTFTTEHTYVDCPICDGYGFTNVKEVIEEEQSTNKFNAYMELKSLAEEEYSKHGTIFNIFSENIENNLIVSLMPKNPKPFVKNIKTLLRLSKDSSTLNINISQKFYIKENNSVGHYWLIDIRYTSLESCKQALTILS
jgi:hypothetical protein